MSKIFLTISSVLLLAVFAAAQNSSSYTSLRAKNCRAIKVSGKDNILSHTRCGGVGGYHIEIYASEEHQWVEVVTPTGKH